MTDDQFKEKFYNKFSKDEYEVVGSYINMDTKIDILHKKCGRIFQSTPKNLLHHNKKGCSHCYSKTKRTIESTNNELIEKGYNDYELTEIWTKDGHSYGKFIHKCEKCNNYEFEMRVTDFFSKHNQKCPKCAVLEKESKAVRNIKQFLDNNNINYIQEYKFNECRNILPLPFDFYIEDLNLCIEYDGSQHFKASKLFGGKEKFKIQKNNDNIKNIFCKNNNINLLRISYKDNEMEKLKKYFY